MKRFLFFFAAITTVALFAISCSDDGDLEDYLPPTVSGEDTSYSPEIVAIIPGYGRVEVVWSLGTEKEITHSYIYWSGGAGVSEAVVSDDIYDSATGYCRKTFSIAEGDYTFFVRNLDADRYISSSSESVSASIYGAVAESELMVRPISSTVFEGNDCTLTWGDSESCVWSSVSYTKSTGQIAEKESAIEDESVLLENLSTDGYVTVTSKHYPYRAVGSDEALAALGVTDAGLDVLEISASKRVTSSSLHYTISSIEELIKPAYTEIVTAEDGSTSTVEHFFYKMDNVSLTMTPGTYTISAENVLNGFDGYEFPICSVVPTSPQRVFISLKGDNNYYDFTGVTINVATGAFNQGGQGGGVYELHIEGGRNTVKGLTLNDVGELTDYPTSGCVNVTVDGVYNLLENVSIYSKGSYPYGYGEMFGKGGTYTIKHFKHSSLLLRGTYNTVRACTIISQSYGHLLFMQGARGAVVEDCWVQGVMGNTDDVLAEEGFGTAADLIDFLTVWGFRVPAGYPVPFSEDGYRTYASGNTTCPDDYLEGGANHEYGSGTALDDSSTEDEDDDSEVDASAYPQTTLNSILRNSTVVLSRGPIAFTLGKGYQYVDNVTIINGASGFQLNNDSGSYVRGGKADPKYGHVTENFYDSSANNEMEIEIQPYSYPHENTSGHVTSLRGSNQDVTLTQHSDLKIEAGLWVQLGGNKRGLAYASLLNNSPMNNSTVYNNTGYPIRLGSLAGATTSNKIYINTNYPTTDVVVESADDGISLVDKSSTEYATAVNQNKFYDIANGNAEMSLAQIQALSGHDYYVHE